MAEDLTIFLAVVSLGKAHMHAPRHTQEQTRIPGWRTLSRISKKATLDVKVEERKMEEVSEYEIRRAKDVVSNGRVAVIPQAPNRPLFHWQTLWHCSEYEVADGGSDFASIITNNFAPNLEWCRGKYNTNSECKIQGKRVTHLVGQGHSRIAAGDSQSHPLRRLETGDHKIVTLQEKRIKKGYSVIYTSHNMSFQFSVS